METMFCVFEEIRKTNWSSETVLEIEEEKIGDFKEYFFQAIVTMPDEISWLSLQVNSPIFIF